MDRLLDDIRRNIIITLSTSKLSARSLFSVLVYIISNSSYSIAFSKRIIQMIKESEEKSVEE